MARSTSMARHSRLYSSMTFKSLRFLPSAVWSNGEVEGPHHVGPDRAEGTDGHPDAAQRALALSIGHTQAFGTPEAVDPLVVDRPAGVSGGPGGASPTPAGAAESEVTQEGPQGELFVAGDRCREALGGAGLADDAARPSL